MQETGPRVYSPYPRRPERLTICRYNYIGNTFSSVILKGLSQPPPFSMTSEFLIKHGEANSYCFTVSCVPEGMFNYLE